MNSLKFTRLRLCPMFNLHYQLLLKSQTILPVTVRNYCQFKSVEIRQKFAQHNSPKQFGRIRHKICYIGFSWCKNSRSVTMLQDRTRSNSRVISNFIASFAIIKYHIFWTLLPKFKWQIKWISRCSDMSIQALSCACSF